MSYSRLSIRRYLPTWTVVPVQLLLWLLLAIAVVEGLAVGVPWFVNWAANPEQIRVDSARNLNRSTGLTWQVSKVVVTPTLLDGLHVQFLNNRFLDARGRPLLETPELALSLRYVPLFQGVREIAHLTVRRPRANLTADSALFRLQALAPPDPSAARFKQTRLQLLDYALNIQDLPDRGRSYRISGDWLRLDNLNSTDPVRVRGPVLVTMRSPSRLTLPLSLAVDAAPPVHPGDPWRPLITLSQAGRRVDVKGQLWTGAPGRLNLTVDTTPLPLTWLRLAPLPPGVARNVNRGRLQTHLLLTGLTSAPAVDGRIQLWDGAWGTTIDTLTTDLRVSLHGIDQWFGLDRLSARAFGGTVNASGRLRLPQRRGRLRFEAQNLSLAALQRAINESGQPLPPEEATWVQSSVLQGRLTARGQVRIQGARVTPSGQLTLTGGQLEHLPTRLTVRDVDARAVWGESGGTLTADGRWQGAPWQLNAQANQTLSRYTVRLRVSQLNLATLMPVLRQAAPQATTVVKSLSGQAQADVTLTQAGTPRPTVDGRVQLAHLRIQSPALPYPVALDRLGVELHGPLSAKALSDVTLPETHGQVGHFAFTAAGHWSPTGPYQLQVSMPPLAIATLVAEGPVLSRWLGRPLPLIQQPEGTLGLNARLTPADWDVRMALRDVGGSLVGAPGVPLPRLSALTGDVHARIRPSTGALTLLSAPDLTARVDGEPVRLSVDAAMPGPVAARLEGQIPGSLVDALLAQAPEPWSDFLTRPEEALPLSVTATGPRWDQLLVTAETDATPWLRASKLSQLMENPAGLPPQPLQLVADLGQNRLQLSPVTLLRDAQGGALQAEARVDLPFNAAQRTLSARLRTPGTVNLGALNPWLRDDLFGTVGGALSSDLQFLLLPGSVPEAPLSTRSLLLGQVAVDQLRSSGLEIQAVDGSMRFEGDTFCLTAPRIQVPGVDIHVAARTEDLWAFPIRLTDVAITGQQFNLPEYQRFNDEILTGKVAHQIVEPLTHPWRPGEPLLPFEFYDAQLALAEVIYQDILLTDVRGRMEVHPSSFVSLSDVHAKVAGGELTTNLSLNPTDNNFLTLSLDAKDVSANALAVALLNVPNQIFGDLSGTIQFTTQGKTDAEMLRNVNGSASFSILNGRIPNIARVESLLTATNILRGGLLGLNLNNLFGAVIPTESNAFARLTGDFQLANGTMLTQNMTSQGRNLTLRFQGGVDLATAQADLVILGRIKRDVGGPFGALGALSLRRLVNLVPILGYIPGRPAQRGGVLSYIPGVGFVPGFGGPIGDFNRFRVIYRGPLGDPGAVQGIEWL